MYFRLEEKDPTAFVEKESGPAIFKLTVGRPYRLAEDQEPFRFTYRDPTGNPLPDYMSGDCLMSRRLLETLKGAGVDNLQTFDAELRDETTGSVTQDFVVVNVIGLVAAADLAKSESLPLADGHVFTSLTIDEGKARGVLMFRLSESLIDVIVHERVARAIEAGGFRGVELTPVSSEAEEDEEE